MDMDDWNSVRDKNVYNIGYDIVIEDEYIKNVKEICQNYSDEIDGYISEYYKIMKDVYNKAVISGQFHERIGQFNEKIQKIKEDGINNITKNIKSDIDKFLKDFDVADNWLY